MEIIQEESLSLVEVKEDLAKIKKRDSELTFRGKKVEEYLGIVKLKKPEELKKELSELDVSRLKDRHIALIMNILPKDADSLKAVLSNENITLRQEDLEKITSIVKNHA